MRTVIIGLGNPMLSDDGAGAAAARLLDEKLSDMSEITVKEVYAGGFRLMDALVGFERAFIIDAMLTNEHEVGDIRRFTLGDSPVTRNLTCSHDASLDVALDTGRVLGLELPKEITIWGIEAGDVETFGESPAPEILASVKKVAAHIIEDLSGTAKPGSVHKLDELLTS